MRIIKNAAHVFSHRLTIIFSNCIRNGKFLDILKYADITPVFKKGGTFHKSNYRPISTLSHFSKMFEKLFTFLTIDKSILCNYADDNTFYTSGNDANAVINKLKQDFSKIFKWFHENFMVANPDKCYSLTLGFQDAPPNFSYDNITIKNVSEEQKLGITNDNKLSLKNII